MKNVLSGKMRARGGFSTAKVVKFCFALLTLRPSSSFFFFKDGKVVRLETSSLTESQGHSSSIRGNVL